MLTSAYEIHLPLSPKIRRSIPFLLLFYFPHEPDPPIGPATPPCLVVVQHSLLWKYPIRRAPVHLSACLPFFSPAVVSVTAHTLSSVPTRSYCPADTHPSQMNAHRSYTPSMPPRKYAPSSPWPRLTPPSPQLPVIDHQKLKDRLSAVVRSKEGCVHPPTRAHAHPQQQDGQRECTLSLSPPRRPLRALLAQRLRWHPSQQSRRVPVPSPSPKIGIDCLLAPRRRRPALPPSRRLPIRAHTQRPPHKVSPLPPEHTWPPPTHW